MRQGPRCALQVSLIKVCEGQLAQWQLVTSMEPGV